MAPRSSIDEYFTNSVHFSSSIVRIYLASAFPILLFDMQIVCQVFVALPEGMKTERKDPDSPGFPSRGEDRENDSLTRIRDSSMRSVRMGNTWCAEMDSQRYLM